MRSFLIVLKQGISVSVQELSGYEVSSGEDMLVRIESGPFPAVHLKPYDEKDESGDHCQYQEQAYECSSFKFPHRFPPPFTARLACSLVSEDFRNARSAQDAIIEVPPFETKGNVTPVNGSMSVHPKMLSIV